MNNEELYLIYVHEIGFDHKDTYFYEFIFSHVIENIDGDEWDSYPASGNPSPPNVNLIKRVGKLNVETKLIVAQNNEQFSMWDAIDGILPLSWEDIEGLEDYPTDRLVFHFGMPILDVEKKLYNRDLILNYEHEYKK